MVSKGRDGMRRLNIILLTALLVIGLSCGITSAKIGGGPIHGTPWGHLSYSLIPAKGGTYNLGSADFRWQDLYVDGMYLKDGTDTHIIKAVQETGLGGRLTIGLDETTRTMVICDAGDVDADLGLGVAGDPSFYMFNPAADHYGRMRYNGLLTSASLVLQGGWDVTLKAPWGVINTLTGDWAAGNVFTFNSDADVELTDTDGEQSWMYVEPKINQINAETGAAGYNALQIKVTETDTDTAADNNLIKAGTTVNEEMFKVGNTGDVQQSSALASTHGGYINKVYSATSGTLTGATDKIELNIPTGWIVKACQLHVKTAVVDDAGDDTWSSELNDGAQEEVISAGSAAAQNTNVNHFGHGDAGYGGTLTDAETDILLTPNAGNFSAGEIEAHCLCFGFDAWDAE